MASYNNYALENQCQPCNHGNHNHGNQSQSSRFGPVNPMNPLIQPQKAQIVSQNPPYSMNESHIHNMIAHMNAEVAGSKPLPQKARAFLSGYNAGVANYR
jgi:hypothetical protein